MKNGTHGLAIGSLVCAVLAMFGVVPLAFFPFLLFCEIVDWIGCQEFDHAIRFFLFSMIFSIVMSTLAISLGFLSQRFGNAETTHRTIARAGIGIGLIAWLLIVLSAALLWLGSFW